jgi:hypothetical protein
MVIVALVIVIRTLIVTIMALLQETWFAKHQPLWALIAMMAMQINGKI